jgi:hypothetical protein
MVERNLNKLAEVTRNELVNDFGLKTLVDVGDDFFNALWYGTLKTLVERVDSSGFCHTSYGEENDVKCYGHTHYPRDTAEAARVLADVGLTDPALRILDFTLRNKPRDQYYIPHVYRPDGSIQANTVQIDTPAHVVRALARCVELLGPEEKGFRMFSELDTILDGTWVNHFHSQWNLLDAGNYNEQLDTKGTVLDLFTNCSMHCGMALMAKMARTFGREALAGKYEERKSLLESGIEKSLYDPEHDIYLLLRELDSGQPSDQVNWVSLYCRRWYPGRPQAWENIFSLLHDRTLIQWGDFKIVSQDTARVGIVGKAFGYLLSFLAGTGKVQTLSEHLNFARKTIRRPVNVYPEWWYYQPLGHSHEYWDGFWQKYQGIWDAWTVDPEADYTVDSGNCEQVSVFLAHFWEDLLGLGVTGSQFHLWPKLPFDFTRVSVKNAPVVHNQSISYELTRDETQTSVHLHQNVSFPLQVTAGMPASKEKINLFVNDQPVSKADIYRQNQVQWGLAHLPGEGKIHWKVSLT